MENRKAVFVQVETPRVVAVSEMLNAVDSPDYYFIILPLDVQLLSIDQVEELLRLVVQRDVLQHPSSAAEYKPDNDTTKESL